MRHLSDADRLAIAAQRGIDASLVTDAMLTPSERDWAAANMGIAGKVAKRLCGNRVGRFSRYDGPDFYEVQSAAYLGLCKAALTYDPTVGVNRCTHAYHTCFWTAKAYINGELGNNRHGYRPPPILFTDIDMTVGLGDLPFDPAAPEPDGFECFASHLEASDVDVAIAKIAPRLGGIVRARLGGETLDDIGKGMGISKERVRQLECQAHKLIRQILRIDIDADTEEDDRGRPRDDQPRDAPGPPGLPQGDPVHQGSGRTTLRPIASRRRHRYRKYRHPRSS